MNKFQPHVLIVPEDDANRQILNGFEKHPSLDHRRVQVLEPAGGWARVRDSLVADHAVDMAKYDGRHLVLVVDCDGRPDRIPQIKDSVPQGLKARVLVVGTLSNPEQLRSALGDSYEAIGNRLAQNCAEGGHESLWDGDLLSHNRTELASEAGTRVRGDFPLGGFRGHAYGSISEADVLPTRGTHGAVPRPGRGGAIRSDNLCARGDAP